MRNRMRIGAGSRRAMTIVEMLLSAIVVGVVTMFLIRVVVLMGREYRVGIVQAEVNMRADMIQDRLLDYLRHVSYSNVVQFTASDAVPGQSGTPVFYYRVIFRKDYESPDQELKYNPNTKQLTYRPDTSVSGNTVILNPSQKMEFSTLDYVWFANGMQPGGVPDNSIMLVQFSVSDHGLARRAYRSVTDKNSWITTNRSYGIFIRNE